MQFINLEIQYRNLKEEIDQSIKNVIESSNYIMGQEVFELEERLAEYVGTKHCITCANGTDALKLSMMAYNIKAGDAVFVPTFTFFASAETISLIGATPVFVDNNRDTFNICTVDLENAIKSILREGKLKPKAIVIVDLFGLPADYEKINEIALKYNLLIIEDAAQGFGGSIGYKRACSFGTIATTSFFPAKPLGCYGDGGAVFTDDDVVKEYLCSIKAHGKGSDKYDNVRIGENSRLDTIQAAILLVKFKAFKEYELETRHEVASWYDKELKDYVKTPYIPEGYNSSYAQYSILFENQAKRNNVKKYLAENGIPTMIYYNKSIHQQSAYQNNPYIYRGFPNAETTSERILNLPMHPYIKKEEIVACCNGIKAALQKGE